MGNFDELDQKFGRFADRLKTFQQERDQRSKLALTMLASIEHKVRSQQVALDKANSRIGELEKERDAAIARATEIVELYENSLTNNDAFFRGIEQLASKLIGPSATAPAPQPKPEAAPPRPTPPPAPPPVAVAPRPATSPRPVATLPPAPPQRTGVVQAPSKTPFLREMGPSQLQPRDRKDDGKF